MADLTVHREPETANPRSANETLLTLIRSRFDLADKGVHAKFRSRAEHFYALYRNYTDWRDGRPVDRRDRDMGIPNGRREWGAELFIPFAFSTVETILPRMLSTSPTVIVKPRNPESEPNVGYIKATIDSQLERMNYELKLQAVCRDALIYGLGVQKVYWLTKTRETRALEHEPINDRWIPTDQLNVLWDDPMAEQVDPFNFFWDPYADSIENCEWVVQRTWRSAEYVRKLVDAGYWTVAEDPKDNGGSSAYSESMAGRMRISGYGSFKASGIHEVWEYHDGTQVVTVLDREQIVQKGKNPAWHGEIPFQAFRPTPVANQLAGIGEIEPIEDLQAEMNTLRSQRRDNATLVLQRFFFYADGMIDPADFKIGPGKAIPTLGDPREALFAPPIGDIPNSSYQEEARIQSDIERTTGIDDSLSGAGSGSQTATGVQLVQAAGNERIRLKTRRCAIELVRAGGRQILALDQQKIREQRDVQVPAEPTPSEPDRRWQWLKVGPAELAGEHWVDIEGGTEADNAPQMRADAQNMMALAQSQLGQMVDPRKALDYILRNQGIKQPENGWITSPSPQVPEQTVQSFQEALTRGGVDPSLVQQAWAAAQPQTEEQ